MPEAPQTKGRRGRPQPRVPALDSIDARLATSMERQVYRRLREALMSGRFAPDSGLSSRSIASALGISAQPVRDALKRLEADGVLESRPQSGFYLRSPASDEYREIIDIRQRLEGLACRIAASAADRAFIAELREINGRLFKAEDRGKYSLEQNYRFHFLIYRHAGRTTLLSTIENFWVRVGPSLHYYPTTFDEATTLAKHSDIREALARGDGPGAEAAMIADLENGASLIIPRLPEGATAGRFVRGISKLRP
jgi:GntR family transcriptional regulator, colanic acid and biofilm gene transcriptional regulator